MAIVGFLTYTAEEHARAVLAALDGMPELTTYGIHNNNVVVVVAEIPSAKLDDLANTVKAIEGVVTVSFTSMSVEDEDTGDMPASEILDRP